MELIAKYWTPIWSILVTLGLLLMGLMSKTYARHDAVNMLIAEIETLKSRLDETPSVAELNRLNVDIVRLSGEIKSLQPQLDSVQRLSDLLLENELKERRK